jgi:pyruvate/2-oxoglutarate/acetoin dehydrogenase E1 component
MSVVGLGQGIVGHVRSKTFTALGAVVLRVNEMDVTGPASNQISNVVQNPGDDIVPPTTMVTTWTGVRTYL